MTYTMKSYNGQRRHGRDYTVCLSDKLEKVMGGSAMSKQEIADKAGRGYDTTFKLINRLHQEGLVHIAKWRRGYAGPPAPLYKLGPGADAERPKALTAKQRCKRYRAGIKGAALKIQRRRERHGIAAVDPLMAAIYGISAQR